jgi:hypothetical protein
MRLLVKGTAFHSAYSSNWELWKQISKQKENERNGLSKRTTPSSFWTVQEERRYFTL